jgi:two-component system, sensor histidine kinase and response regulator
MLSIYSKMKRLRIQIKRIGYSASMGEAEERRLGIFNQINFLGVLTGLIVPAAGLNSEGYMPILALVIAFSPFIISIIALLLNYFKKHQFALVWYFLLYPTVTSIVYFGGIDVGIELFYILYAVLAVFFLQRISTILFTISFSVVCYLVVFTLHGKYNYVMKDINPYFYFFNQALSLFFIFLGLILIKKENNDYQEKISSINKQLISTNDELNKNRLALLEKTNLLEVQTNSLEELNALKNRMFSIISHDLKNPIYSLRNLFVSVNRYNMSGDEIKILVPDILNDLNYTTSLMDNLLLWAKSQMQGFSINLQEINLKNSIEETINLLHLQAQTKKIVLSQIMDSAIDIYVDKDMISLVLRNLISNAIKFTPEEGIVQISAVVKKAFVEISIKDSGIGISKHDIAKLFIGDFKSKKGTNNENGTGLGLMLCKEFIDKHEGEISVLSEIDKGSTFIFTVPRA